MARPSKAEISSQGLKISLEKVERVLSDVAEDIIQYIELSHLQNHILAIDDPSLHSTLQVSNFDIHSWGREREKLHCLLSFNGNRIKIIPSYDWNYSDYILRSIIILLHIRNKVTNRVNTSTK